MFVKQTGESAPDDIADYNPDAFYTADGGGETIRARVSSDLMRSVTSLILDPDFPHYHTQADVVRDALVHLIHRRLHQSKDPALLHTVTLYTRRERILRMEEDIQRDEQLARIIAARWPRAVRQVKEELYPEARRLVREAPIDDNLKDLLRPLLTAWELGEGQRYGIEPETP